MEWIEGRIRTARQGTEPVTAMLMALGIDSVVIEDNEEMKDFLQANPLSWDYVDDKLYEQNGADVVITFYTAGNGYGGETVISVKDGLAGLRPLCPGLELGALTLELVNVDDEAWLNEWKKYYKPLKIGERVVVKPVWEQYTPASGGREVVFTINPGSAFGTGMHQTTRLCVAELEKYVRRGSVVLDLGCGSGILSIIAVLLGASRAVAVDFDPAAVDTARENALLNGVGADRYTTLYGNVLTDAGLREKVRERRYGVVAANIVADAIVSLSDFVPGCLSEGGVFIASGIIRERLGDVREALLASGFEIKAELFMDSWVCTVAVLGGSYA